MASNREGVSRFLSRAVWLLAAGILLQSISLDCAETPFAGAAPQEGSGEGGAPPPANQPEGGTAKNPGGEGAPKRVSLTELTDRLGREYPDREAIVRGGEAVPRALLEFVRTHAGDTASAADVGQARLLAAEAFLVLGRRAEALKLYAELAGAGPLDSHRALALFVLGEDQFLRERYLTGRRRAADYYWGLLTRRFPQSQWAARVERPMRYIDFLSGSLKGGRQAPAFVGTFEQATAPGQALEKRSYSTEELRGKVVLVEFWTAAVPERGERVKTLAAGLATNLKEYPDLKGKIQALGVNLDTSRELFDSAIAAWGTPWPELHDGLGFRTPLAEAFAIPRVPQWVVIEASGGRVVHIGSDYDRFLAAASRELRRARGLKE